LCDCFLNRKENATIDLSIQQCTVIQTCRVGLKQKFSNRTQSDFKYLTDLGKVSDLDSESVTCLLIVLSVVEMSSVLNRIVDNTSASVQQAALHMLHCITVITMHR